MEGNPTSKKVQIQEQTFQKESIAMLLKPPHKVEKEGKFSNSFYEVGITLIPKGGKHTTTTTKLQVQFP